MENSGLALAKDGLPYTTLGYQNGPGGIVPNGLINGTRRNLTGVDTSDKDFKQQSAYGLSSETHGGDDVGRFGIGKYRFSRNITPECLTREYFISVNLYLYLFIHIYIYISISCLFLCLSLSLSVSLSLHTHIHTQTDRQADRHIYNSNNNNNNNNKRLKKA